jgi:hypothetical protein
MNGSPALRSGETPRREYKSGVSVCTVAPNALVRISGLRHWPNPAYMKGL